ncbi:hypothetical protein AY555_02060 [Haematospirillum jordaniae]|uniref:Uncharacterized protein n=1 Tax=Haematospirillum jordaniae TaxID=1549855 RepID=A0A143DBN7_9PROT|nr:hypothetical protein AY555_02060 [Haematospirillum jordaniae]
MPVSGAFIHIKDEVFSITLAWVWIYTIFRDIRSHRPPEYRQEIVWKILVVCALFFGLPLCLADCV